MWVYNDGFIAATSSEDAAKKAEQLVSIDEAIALLKAIQDKQYPNWPQYTIYRVKVYVEKMEV